MEFNATLIGQAIVFLILIWFTVKFIWPPLTRAIEERQKKIAEGLSAADRGRQELEEAKSRADAIIREARERASQIIEQAQHRANDMIEQAKSAAAAEGQRLVAAAQQQIELEASQARENLRRDVAQLAVRTAAKLLEREIDERAHADLINKLAAQI
ncbi:MAG: F0F1 ATP synthase subunit B [Pseudomonadota bacterium]|jgi:ATP synthase, F0 subunit b|nr:MAG: F0F1 ATP synthase subunit B [Pseudomonadota bacterium]